MAAQTTASQASRVEQGQRFRIDSAAREQARRRLAPIFGDQAPASPGDADLGEQVLLRRQEQARPISLFTDLSGFYTSNAALTDRNTVDDFFLVGQVGASYQSRIAPDLFGEVTVRQAAFRYAKFSELDFDSLNLGAGLTYIVRPLWGIAVGARYNYNRLTDASQHDEFFKNHTLTLSLLKTFELSKAHYVFVGYSTIFGSSEPVAPQRDEHGVFLGYRANLTRSLAGDFYYRVALFDYVGGRKDWNQSLAATLKFELNKFVTVSASLSGGFNNSDREVFDYKVFNAGVSLAALVSF